MLTVLGMPRVLLCAAHVSTLVLDALDLDYTKPEGAANLPLPSPYLASPERVDKLQSTDLEAFREGYAAKCKASSVKPFCNIERAKLPPVVAS